MTDQTDCQLCVKLIADQRPDFHALKNKIRMENRKKKQMTETISKQIETRMVTESKLSAYSKITEQM